ncbi:MAG: Stp1/IreP family PP2C-type Ser/Thr phosphatase, partial [Anaerolineae bacterium]|nr:Stp1/IreP family PP2C-type Ser/Thr phosphatase [Anaerolineae bacterium]
PEETGDGLQTADLVEITTEKTPTEGETQDVLENPTANDEESNESVDEAEAEEPGTETVIPEPPGITRPLPEEATSTGRNGHILYGQASDTGMVRSNNQDSAVSFYYASNTYEELPDFGVFIVADGMGGHKEGEKASSITATEVMKDIFKTVFLPMVSGEEMTSERLTIREALQQSIQKANNTVRKEVKDGGTTITAIVVLGDQAHIGHVGDSRAYVLNPGSEMEQITRDHSVVQRLLELDKINQEEAEQHEQRNVLYRAIGQNEDVEPDIMRRRLESNTYILLCSDGLWGIVNDSDMKDIILGSENPQEACNKLIAQANTNGGNDNITAILLKIPGN